MAGADVTGEDGEAGAGRWGEGDVVAGVRLTGRVGRGRTGVVWAGRETGSGERVAVRLLDASVAAAAEGALLRAAVHPHVVRVRRLVHDPPALVLDLAEGGSVASLVRARGVLDPGEVVTILAPLAGALASLRDAGLCHGDVTAANVLLLGDGRPVLADLGAARLLGTGPVGAASGFAAPEVVAGDLRGAASDVHGLGAVGWFALTGSPPGPVAERVPLSLLSPECPDELAGAITAAVAPRAAARPPVEEVGRLVYAAVPARPVRLAPGASPALRPDEAVTRDAGQDEAAQVAVSGSLERQGAGGTGARLRRVPVPAARLAAAAAAVAVALAVAGVAVGSRSPSADGEPAAPGPAHAAEHGPSSPSSPSSPSAPEVESAVRGLVAARGEALRRADPSALARVHAPGSDALAADREAIADGPLEVGYEVMSVTPTGAAPGGQVAATPTVSGGAQGHRVGHTHTVDVELRTWLAGEQSRTERVRLLLARSGERWSILSVGEPR